MNRTRLIAIGSFTAVIVLLLVAIFWVESVQASHTVRVWQVLNNVTVNAGHSFSTDVVQQVDVKGAAGEFAYTTQNPSNNLVFREGMKAGDIVRDDDIQPASEVAQIPITAEQNVDFSGTDRVDIYLLDTKSGKPCVVSARSQVPVVSGTGTTIVIQVPRADELYWLTLTNAGTGLYKILITPAGGTAALPGSVCLDAAIQQLERSASGGAPAATPPPSG